MPPSATWWLAKYGLPQPPYEQGKALLMPTTEAFFLFCFSPTRAIDFLVSQLQPESPNT